MGENWCWGRNWCARPNRGCEQIRIYKMNDGRWNSVNSSELQSHQATSLFLFNRARLLLLG
jgi:hypothetical protein